MKYRRYFRYFPDFLANQLSVAKIISMSVDIRYIGNISANKTNFLFLDVYKGSGDVSYITRMSLIWLRNHDGSNRVLKNVRYVPKLKRKSHLFRGPRV